MGRLILFCLVLHVSVDIANCQPPLEHGSSISIEKAAELMQKATHQWDLAEKKSIFIQGTIRNHILLTIDGVSEVQLESEVVFGRNKNCGVSLIRTKYPIGRAPEVMINNRLYFAVLVPSTEVDRAELTFLEWIKYGLHPPVNHNGWNTTNSVANFTKPYSFDKSAVYLNELVEHPDFVIKEAQLENGLLSIDFELFLADPRETGGLDDILGGRLELDESLNWFPKKVAIDAGSKGGIIYTKKVMRLEYEKTNNVDEIPILNKKVFTETYVKPIPKTGIRPGIEQIHEISMDLVIVKSLPGDQEFQLSAFGLPDPVRPRSMAAIWWKWGGGLLVAGIAFAAISMKLGRKK